MFFPRCRQTTSAAVDPYKRRRLARVRTIDFFCCKNRSDKSKSGRSSRRSTHVSSIFLPFRTFVVTTFDVAPKKPSVLNRCKLNRSISALNEAKPFSILSLVRLVQILLSSKMLQFFTIGSFNPCKADRIKEAIN